MHSGFRGLSADQEITGRDQIADRAIRAPRPQADKNVGFWRDDRAIEQDKPPAPGRVEQLEKQVLAAAAAVFFSGGENLARDDILLVGCSGETRHSNDRCDGNYEGTAIHDLVQANSMSARPRPSYALISLP
jgi:hypothetical protein